MASYSVNEEELLQLNVGDFVGVMTHHMGDNKIHWTLGSVESPPYLRDVEIRLWEKQKGEYNTEEVPATEETEALMNRIAQVKGELQNNIEEADALTEQLRARRAAIKQQIGEADEYVAESKAVAGAAREDVESIPDKHWQELKSYRVPPKMVALVIRAVMLLLSEDEARTWPQMQRILRDFNFKQRITGYDPDQQLSPERREYILQECVSKKSFRYDRAMQGSVAVGPIYYWVLAQLDVGEAQSQKNRVDKEALSYQKELRSVLTQLNEQQQRIAEYQELMDDLDDQLRMCHKHRSNSLSPSRSQLSASRSRARGLANNRYAQSFAYAEGKEYLKPAFFPWIPTDRVIIVLRKNVVANYGTVVAVDPNEPQELTDPQIRELDRGLLRRQRELQELGAEDREGRDFEQNLYRQDEGQHSDKDASRGVAPAADSAAQGAQGVEASDKLQRRFDGKNWQKVLERKRMAIVNTFTEESAECLEVPEYYISVDDLTIGSLVVDFTAQHDGSRTKNQLQSKVDQCGYPKLMKLYEDEEEAIAAEEAPEHQMKFGGDRWEHILPNHRDEVLDAFLEDTSKATGVEKDEVEVMDVRVEDDGLTVDYSVKNKNISAEEVQTLVDQHDYAAVWALYQRLSGLVDGAGPLHQVRFRGERWKDLMVGHEEEIKEAFLKDTSNALEVDSERLVTEEMRYDRGLVVPYVVVGECKYNDDDMDQRVEDYKYPEVWTLYDRLLAEAAGAEYQKAFEGRYWEAVLNEARPSVTDAFVADTAAALSVAPEEVEPCSLDTDDNRLVVCFNVTADNASNETIKENVREYSYPKVWDVYRHTVEELEAAKSDMNKDFEGDLWPRIVHANEGRVKDAFKEDAVEALQVGPRQVNVKSVTPGDKSMTVHYSVEGEGLTSYDVKANVNESEFSNVWKLYKEAEANPAGFGISGRGETAILERRFADDDWDLVLDGAPEELSGAYRRDVAKCLDVGADRVRVNSCEIGSLIVKYQVLEPGQDDEEIEERVNEYDFPELYNLYKRRVRGGEEGESGAAARAVDTVGDEEREDAADVASDENREEAAEEEEDREAAAEDVAEEDEDREESTKDAVDDEEDESGAARAVDTAGDQERDDAAAIDSTRSFGGENEDGASRFRKSFQGKGWSDVVAEDRDAVEEAFKKDQAECLDVSEDDVLVKSIRTDEDGLHVNYDVRDGVDVDDDEVGDKSEAYHYPALWNLYSEKAEEGWVVTSHQVGFDGEDWKYVLENKREALENAFVVCTADLFDLLTRNVENAQYSIGSLIVDFDLKHPVELTEEEINRKLNECPYEPVWDLYGEHPYDPNEIARTTHDVGFEGVGWSDLLDAKPKEIEIAFVEDTAEALGVEPKDVKVEQLTYEEDSLFVRADVQHSVLQDQELIQEQLTRHPYDRLWALYEENAESEFVKTSHQVGFDGTDWKYVVDNKNDELQKAFTVSTAEIFDLRTRHLHNVQYTVEETSLLVDFVLRHAPELTEDEINQKLGECPYDDVWDLYGDHPYDPNEITTTAHEVGFEGEEWGAILEKQHDELQEAVIADTADALNIEPESVKATDMKFADNTLIVRMPVEHSVLQDRELIQEQLSRCPFERVWAIYEDAPVVQEAEEAKEAEEAEEAPARGLTGGHRGETEILERRFEDDDWDILLDGAPEDLNDAFRRDAAQCLGVPQSNIRVVSAEIGSLVVKYQVVDPEEEDDEIENRLNGYEFPELYGLYRRRVRGGDEGEGGAAREAANEEEEVVAAPQEEEEEQIAPQENEREEEEEEQSAPREEEETAPEEAAAAPEEEAEEPEEPVERGVAAAAAEEEEEEEAAPEEPFKKSFPGDNWEASLEENNREAVEDAFKKDTADALGVQPEQINVKSVKADDEGLHVEHTVEERPEDLTRDAVGEKTSAHEYPAVWSLYEEAGDITTSHQIDFEAEHWDFLVRRRRWELSRAVADDSAEALEISSEAAVDMQLEVTPERLTVVEKLQHPRSLTVEEINEKLHVCPFNRTWAMYENLAPSDELVKTFSGENWGKIVEENTPALESAFATDTGKSLNLSRLEVEVRSTEVENEELKVVFVVRGSNLNHGEMQSRVNGYPYPETWALYGVPGGVTQFHGAHSQRTFDGESWGEVITDKRQEVEEAFKEDTAAALNADKDAVNVSSLYSTEKGLVVNYGANVPQENQGILSKEEVEEKVNEYDFPRLWNLYEESNKDREAALKAGGDRESGQLERRFEGDDWDLVLDGARGDIDDCFQKGVSDSVGVSKSNVVVLDAQIGSLVMQYKVRGSDYDDEEIQQKVGDHDFPELMSLYKARIRAAQDAEGDGTRQPLPEGWVETPHQAGFDGDDWLYVVQTNEGNLKKAFARDTGACLDVAPKHVYDVNPIVDNQLLVEFMVQHPEEVSEKEVDEKLRKCAFKEVWSLYGTHPYDASERVTSQHDVGFEGEDWLYVLGKKKSELLRAFSIGTGHALTIPASDVVNVSVEPTETEGIIFVCSIHHNANLDEEVIREQLKAYPYEEIWALYEVRPYDENDKIESVHQIDFEGDAWNVVCELQGQELRRALVADTAAAMDIKEEDVLQVDQEITPTALVARVKVQHSPLQDTEMIQEMLYKYEYENVWALYDISVESEALSKNFGGGGWAALVESHQVAITTAFQNDVGVMLNLPARFIKVQGVDTTKEDMTVRYSVYGQWFPEDEIRNRADSYPFPEVWGLYKPSEDEQAARDIELGHAEPIQMVFSGELWSEIEDEKHEELVQAFKKDTADALGEQAPEKVEVTSFYANKNNGLVANFRAADSGLARDDVEKKVKEYDYPSVWRLYEEEESRREEEEARRVAEEKEREEAIQREAEEKEQQEAAQREAEENERQEAAQREAEEKERQEAEEKERQEAAQREAEEKERQEAEEKERAAAAAAALKAKGDRESGQLERRFEGDDWDLVLDGARGDIDDCFQKGVSDSVGVSKSNVVVLDAQIGSLVMQYKVRGSDYEDEEIEQKVADYDFPELMSLYKARIRGANGEGENGAPREAAAPATEEEQQGEEDADREAVAAVVAAEAEDLTKSTHDVSFEGDAWPFVMSRKAKDVHLGIQNDTAEALGVPVSDVEDITTKVTDTALLAVVKVKRTPETEVEDRQRALEEYEFPRTWALYCPPEEAPKATKRFDGSHWAPVVDSNEAALHSAFQADTSRALNLPAEDIEVDKVKAAEDHLEVKYTVQFTQSTAEEVENATEAYPYPSVWALYRPDGEQGILEKGAVVPGEENFVRTPHATKFEGEDWGYVLKKNEPQVLQAFKEDTAEALSLEPRHVKNAQLSSDKKGANAVFEVSHSPDLDAKTATTTINEAPYERVWALYEAQHIDPTSVTTEACDVGFEGEDWDWVYSHKKAEINETFAREVATALDIAPSAVSQRVSYEKSADGMVLTTAVTHLRSQDRDSVLKLLKAFDFPEVWALYEARPYDPNERIQTKHSISFEGEDWGFVMKRKSKDVHLAVQNDAAEALQLQLEDVIDVQTSVKETGLVAVVTMSHSPLQDKDMIEEEFSKYDFERVWALYCPPSEVSTLQKQFPGQWQRIVADQEGVLRKAFSQDTAKALYVVPEDVEVKDLQTDNERLTVSYAVYFSHLSDEDIEADVRNHPYPLVWALYNDGREGGLTELSADNHRKVFDGKQWDSVLQSRRDDVKEAFSKDTAEAVQADPSAIKITSLTTAPEGLVVGYRVENEEVTPEQVEERVRNYDYPSVWNLYPEEVKGAALIEDRNAGAPIGGGDRESGQLERRFEGDDWDLVLDGARGDIDDCFQKGVSDAVGVSKSNVVVLDAQIGSLVMQYKVRGSDYDDEEIEQKVGDHDFPELMSLYKARIRGAQSDEGAAASREAPAPAPVAVVAPVAVATPAEEEAAAALVGTRFTDLSVSFEGDDWDYVLEKKSAKLTDAFKQGTATALGLTKQDVTVLEFVLGSLLVQFRVQHPANVSEVDMRLQIDSYPYEEVWALYEERPAAGVASTHDVGFEAENWEYVDRMKHDQIVERFIQATAKACEVEESAVTNVQVSTYPQLMKITCDVAHPTSIDAGTINTNINRYPYEEVWDLYLDAPVGKESGLLSKTFEGADWDYTLENSRNALHDAYVNDASRCLQIPRSAVSVKDMKTGSLVVDYTVRTSNMEDSEINSRIDAYPFPEVWSLYKPRESQRNAPTNQRIFKGAAWDVVVEKKRSELREAFVADTADARQTEADNVQLTSLYTTEGGLVVNFRAHKDDASYEDVEKASRDGEYARTWELYRQWSDDGFVISEHEVGFDGEDWDYVIEKNKDVLMDTFVMSTAEELGLQSRHVTDLKPIVDAKGVSFQFSLKHPKDWKNSDIDAKLKEYEYTAVWELYETRPYDPSRVVVTSHEVNFEGEDWDYTLEQKREEVEQAFKEDTAEALNVEPEAVNSVRVEKTENGIVIGANVQHSPLLDKDLAADELKRHSFERVWKTYVQRPVDPRGDLVSSTHQVGFEGDRWRDVMAARRVRVVDALRVDTAQALHIPPEDVTDIVTKESPTMLVATLTVQHPRANSTKEVQEELSKYEYERVWALYDDIVNPQVDVMKTRAVTSRMSGLLTKRFDGTDWDLALDAYPDRLRAAFVQDTAEVLQSPEDAVVVDGMMLGSLVVQYRVRDLPMSEDLATELATNYAYPRVWALYRSRENTAAPPLASSRGAPQSALSQTPRRSARAVEPVPENDVDEEAARREAEEAQRAAEEAQRRGDEAARASRAAKEELERADEEARREEEEAQRALERARNRRQNAKDAAEQAQAEEIRRAQEALEEKQRAVEAAQKAEEAAEEARRRRVKPLGAEEMMNEEESIKYLRKALADARRERDDYLEKLEHVKGDGIHEL